MPGFHPLLISTVFVCTWCCTSLLWGQTVRWSVQEKRDNIELFSEAQIQSQPLWEQIQDVAEELDTILGVRTSGAPVQVIVLRDHTSYLRYLAAKIPQAKTRKAIYYRNGEVSQVYTYQNRALLVDVRHEFTHALLHQHLPYAPLWLDEGLAEFFEENASSRLRSSRISELQWRARTGRSPSLKSLESIPRAEAMGGDTYRDSWAWSSFFLCHSVESRDLLRRYIHAIHRGEAVQPLSTVATAEIPGLNELANSYFRKMTIRVTFDSSR